ncbi:MAG: pyruvate dehydrogenase complex dihydrolipoamide acetyltransferase [Myxococcaceae bacterium]|nr:pyruvate dehydrogenase complex dihydrolipoamide acetyltransferase [Myxococcaceae bacterium]
MATPVLLPALSPTMAEGKITKWLKKEGDKISSGTAIAELETDKSNLEIEAYDDGVLLKIVVPAGTSAAVGAPIAFIGKAGEVVDAAAAAAPAKVAAPAAKPAAAPVAAAPAPVAVAAPAPVAMSAPAPAANGRLRASPLAKRIAQDQGVDLASLAGSGPMGRIVKRDVEEALAKGPAPRAVRSSGPRAASEALPITQMRKVIAQRLTEVKPGVPHFYLTIEVEMDEALKLREEAKALETKVSVNDVLVKAAAIAVARFPRINQTWQGDKLVQAHAVDVGVAVAIEDGLITPVVKDADQKGLAELSAEIRVLADKAKKRALKPEEYTGGSITVSNLGMYGIDSFIAIINPPQSAILAVGAVTPKPVVRDGQMVIRQMMSITLSGDHRVIDGAVGAQYLKELKSLLEHPLRLLF